MNWSRVEQRIGTNRFQRLQQAKVGIVGLGSGGGFVALNLAKSGVRHFTLVDDDVMEVGNVVRHVCDLRSVGQLKVTAVSALIAQRNPEAVVKTYPKRIQDCWQALAELDLLIVGVDGERSKFEVNAVCLERKLTAIYAGVYERGEGGDVVWIRAGEGPCYACWAAQLREDIAELPEGPALDYGLSIEEQDLRAEPGLWLDVVRVAAAQTHFALAVLSEPDDGEPNLRGNTLLIANRDLEFFPGVTTPAQSSHWIQIDRQEDCLVCGAVSASAAEDEPPVSLQELTAPSPFDRQDSEQ